MTVTPSVATGTLRIPEAKSRQPRTSTDKLDDAVRALREHADEWAESSLGERIRLLDWLRDDTVAQVERWIHAALEAKGISPDTPAEGEEWVGGPVCLLRNVRLLTETLRDLRDHGRVRLPAKPWTRNNGQVVVPVFPTDTFDKLTFSGFTGEVWMDPSVTEENLPEHIAGAYGGPRPAGKVALVLGAGNVSSIGPMDALYKLFSEHQVVVLKMNPVNEYLGPVFEDCFRAFIDRGFLRIVYGGAEEGKHLCEHEGVDEIHITGSDKTHDAIVFGTGEKGAERKRKREPINDKRITSELGNVSPIIVVPGPWSESDLAFQGENLASSLANNAGFNCNATRAIVTHEGWPQRGALLDAIRDAFKRAPERTPYYPGARERYEAFVAEHGEQAERFGKDEGDRVPWTLIPGLDPSKRDDICFTTEAFCGVTGEVPLSADDTVEYIRKAVDFCNDTLWGTLNAAIVVHPETMKDPKVAEAVEQALEDLRYGSVALNHWPALAYGFVSTTWGAHPGHELHDIQSGIGVVHNTYLLDKPEKSIIRGPFRAQPKPAWFITHRTSHRLLRKLTYFTADPSWLKLPGIIYEAVRG